MVSTEGPVRVLDKAVDVLEALERSPRTAADLAAEIAEPRSTIYRLLRGLSARGLVEESHRSGEYQLGIRVFELGSRVAARFGELRENALPVMERLNRSTGQTIFLVTRSGLRGVCLERIDGHQVQVMILPRGGSVALHGGSASRVLLAYAPPQIREDFFAQTEIERYTSQTPDLEVLRIETDEIRRRGYSISSNDVVPGIAAIGAPIYSHDGTVSAAISITGLEPSVLRDNQANNVQLVIDAAAEVSRSIGYRALDTVSATL